MSSSDARITNVQRIQLEFNDSPAKTNENEPVKNGRIFLAAITANISAIAVGTCMTWYSPIGPKLRSKDTSDSPLNRPVNTDEDAWISSMIAIGALLTPFIAGPLADKIGRKKVLHASSIFFIIGYILMLIGSEVWILLVGRLIKGFGIGFVMSVAPMYAAEVSNDQTRGATGSLMSFLLASGLFYVLCIGPFVSYVALQYFCLLIPLIFVVAFIFMPESPYYYLAKGQRTEATKALQFLRGQSAQAVQKELLAIESLVQSSMAEKGGIMEILKSAGNRKALLICLGLIFFQQVSGINAVLFNSQSIFESANMNFEAAIASIIVGFVQTISAGLTPFVASKLKRKTILIISALLMTIGLAALGYFFYLKLVIDDTTGVKWLPVPALMLYIISFTMGIGPLPWTILGEIFPQNVKSIASAMTASNCWIIGFFVAYFYPALDALGNYYAFWLFALFCVAAFFFVLFIVIETKDLSLQEIQDRLNNKKV